MAPIWPLKPLELTSKVCTHLPWWIQPAMSVSTLSHACRRLFRLERLPQSQAVRKGVQRVQAQLQNLPPPKKKT